MLPDTEVAGAMTVAERIRHDVMGLKIPHAQSAVDDFVTISAGVATIIPTNDHEPGILIKGADRALYKAKTKSRNTSIEYNLEEIFND